MAEQNTPRRRQSRQQQPVDNTYAHLQPQALDVERAVLGALLVDKDAYSVVCEILKPESFYEPRNKIIYEAIQQLSMNEQPVDVLSRDIFTCCFFGPCGVSCTNHCPKITCQTVNTICQRH